MEQEGGREGRGGEGRGGEGRRGRERGEEGRGEVMVGFLSLGVSFSLGFLSDGQVDEVGARTKSVERIPVTLNCGPSGKPLSRRQLAGGGRESMRAGCLHADRQGGMGEGSRRMRYGVK